ncbi:tail fiber assembly protein [Serratia fonticola]|uniref:tail fiber assembly protein n=1 Tax=Serratia fonticola TaxID=47917 RepID=UPI00301D5B8E
MSYGYSASTNILYVLEDKPAYDANGNWPEDVKPITDAEWTTYCTQGPEGKMRGADSQGLPCWVDIPQPSKAQAVQAAKVDKSQRLALATKNIAPLQDAQELGIASEDEQAQLLAWKRYRVLINRLEPNDAPDIDWPLVPEA